MLIISELCLRKTIEKVLKNSSLTYYKLENKVSKVVINR